MGEAVDQNMYFLKKTEKYFVNPHGEEDKGGTELHTVTNLDEEFLAKVKPGVPYVLENEIIEYKDYEPEPCPDGYSSSFHVYTYTQLNKEDFLKMTEVTQIYNTLASTS
jgi:hypothetical protein